MASNQNPAPIEVEKYLAGIDYPVKKDQLVRHAQGRGAPDNVCSILDKLPSREYRSPTDVSEGVGQVQ